ncbi:nitroreductase family protein, partial [Cyclobacterium qasimii]
IPNYLLNIGRKVLTVKRIFFIYFYDYKRFCKYSPVISGYNNRDKLEAKIIERYHSIEKGLTMPDFRFNFGIPVLTSLTDNCIEYNEKYGESTQLKHALSVIFEYEKKHIDSKVPLNQDTIKVLNNLKNKIKNREEFPLGQKLVFKTDYFSEVNSNFSAFSNSRKSLRNYLEDQEVDLNLITNAIEIAKNAPSACNRQSVRVYVFSDKEQIKKILKIQGGNRGFGHLTNKLIIITSDLSVWGFARERNQTFIDGGIFAMNLLYGLHFQQIGACILNCSLSPENDVKLRSLGFIRESENFISMISCGILPEKFMQAASKRHEVSEILTIIK